MAATSSDASHSQQVQIRTAVLTLLTEEPYNGLEIIKEVGDRTGTNWRLTDAELYPLLDQLRTEGLIRLAVSGGGFSRQRPYELTEEGREYVTEHAATLVPLWDTWSDAPPAAPPTGEENPMRGERTARPATEDTSRSVPDVAPAASAEATSAAERFRDAADRFSVAVNQVIDVGSDRQLERARLLVADSKRGLYQILATEEEDDADRPTE